MDFSPSINNVVKTFHKGVQLCAVQAVLDVSTLNNSCCSKFFWHVFLTIYKSTDTACTSYNRTLLLT